MVAISKLRIDSAKNVGSATAPLNLTLALLECAVTERRKLVADLYEEAIAGQQVTSSVDDLAKANDAVRLLRSVACDENRSLCEMMRARKV